MKKSKGYKVVRIYFKPEDKSHMEVYKQIVELSKSMGVSMSTAAGMSLRRGVPLVKAGWDELQKQ